jgi:hypothetical protein
MAEAAVMPYPRREATMADQGYSGTPLAKKIGLKAHHRLVLRHRPDGWEIPGLPEGVEVIEDTMAGADVVVAFYRRREALEEDTPGIVRDLPHAGALWIAWPRRAAGHTSDITENNLRDLLLPTGLVDVKVAAMDEDWSGLKFVWRVEYRHRHE